MPERERDDLVLNEHRELIGHLRTTTLSRAQHLQALAIDVHLPAVIGRAMHAHYPTRLRNPELTSQRKQSQAIAEQHVILSHADSSHRFAPGSLRPHTDDPAQLRGVVRFKAL